MQTSISTFPAEVRSGAFVSDLHLFSARSAADGIHRQLSRFNHAEQCIVLGGDIFDFRWSERGSHAETVQAALDWLENLLADTGGAQVQFLPGNHDCHPDFLNLLSSLAAREPRFGWHAHHVQIGNSLFLHGDILDARGSLPAYRRRFHHSHPQTQLSQRAYDVAVGMRFHKLVPLVRHPPPGTCQRLWGFIQSLPSYGAVEIEKVFFGHTHIPIHGHRIGNVRFYNPGAALKHMKAHVHQFAFDSVTSLSAHCKEDFAA